VSCCAAAQPHSGLFQDAWRNFSPNVAFQVRESFSDDLLSHPSQEFETMKVSLIALVAGCAVASSAFALQGAGVPTAKWQAADLPGTHPPQAQVADLPGTHPPQAQVADLPGTHPPQAQVADLPGTHPPQVQVADLPGTHPPQAQVADLPGTHPPQAQVVDLPGTHPPQVQVAAQRLVVQ